MVGMTQADTKENAGPLKTKGSKPVIRGRCQIPRVWYTLLEGNAQQTFGLDHTLFSITSFYAIQAAVLPVGKTLYQNFQITQCRDLSGKDWMECNLL